MGQTDKFCQWCGHADPPISPYVDRDGRARKLCGRCLDHAVERRKWEVERSLIEERLKAMSKQMTRLEGENEELRGRVAAMMIAESLAEGSGPNAGEGRP